MKRKAEFKELIGHTLAAVELDRVDNDIVGIRFRIDPETEFLLTHDQDCCESVYVESIVGDLQDLVGSPIIRSEEVNHENCEMPEGISKECHDSFTWTFYKLATRKGYVDIRWLGESNGYYSESVDFYQVR